jgi:peptidoglycan hydrolase CwlO-like protein
MNNGSAFQLALYIGVGVATLFFALTGWLSQRVVRQYDESAAERDSAISDLRDGQKELRKEVRALKRQITRGDINAHDQVKRLDKKVDQILQHLDS